MQTAPLAQRLLVSGRFRAPLYQAKQRQHGRTTAGATNAAQHDLNNASASIESMRQALPNRLHRDSRPPRGHVPRRLCPIHPSTLQLVLPRTQKTDPLIVSECMKCIVGEPTQAVPIVTHHNPFSERHHPLDITPTLHHRLLRPSVTRLDRRLRTTGQQ